MLFRSKGDPLRSGEARMGRRRLLRRFGCGGFGVLRHLIQAFSSTGPESGRTEQRSPREAAQASRPFSFIRTLTVGFGLAPNLLTLPRPQGLGKALAGLSLSPIWGLALTAGGEFRPALRTSAARTEQPLRTMTKRFGRGKRLCPSEPECGPCQSAPQIGTQPEIGRRRS